MIVKVKTPNATFTVEAKGRESFIEDGSHGAIEKTEKGEPSVALRAFLSAVEARELAAVLQAVTDATWWGTPVLVSIYPEEGGKDAKGNSADQDDTQATPARV